MDLKELKFLQDISTKDCFTITEWEIIDKVCAKRARDLYDMLCKDEDICSICGRDLGHDGIIIVKDNRSGRSEEVRNISLCSDVSCLYNRDIGNKYQERYEQMCRKSSRHPNWEFDK